MHVKRLLAIYLCSRVLQYKVAEQNRKLEINGKIRQNIGKNIQRSTYEANTSSPWNRILFRYQIPMAVSNIVRINSDFCQHIDRFFAFFHSSVRSSSALKLTHTYNMQYIFRSLLAGMLCSVVVFFSSSFCSSCSALVLRIDLVIFYPNSCSDFRCYSHITDTQNILRISLCVVFALDFSVFLVRFFASILYALPRTFSFSLSVFRFFLCRIQFSHP